MGYIVRIDKPKDSSKGTHGWQVRVHTEHPGKYHSRLFSDGAYGGQEEALGAAEAYLDQYLAEHPEAAERSHPSNKPYHKGKLMKHNQSGKTGVYYTEYAPRWNKGELVSYWCAFIPGGPDGQKRWHKQFNVERYGYEDARALAMEFRQEWEKAVDQGEQAVAEFFEEYHYSRLVDTQFGSEERELDLEIWESYGEVEKELSF
jgi:hypothetical protein